MLRVDNNGTGAAATGVEILTETGKPPMKVNRPTKVTNLNADRLDGQDFTSFDAKYVIDDEGPLPIERTFTTQGGTIIIMASGSGYRYPARMGGHIGMGIVVDGNGRGVSDVTTNERDTHRAFVPSFTVLRLGTGTHTLRLEPLYFSTCNTASETVVLFCTRTNSDDYFRATILEIPD
jgi:hypothetical protein